MRVGYTYVCTFALVAAAVAAPFTLPRLLESHGSAGPARTTAAPPLAADTVVRMAALPTPSAVVHTQHVPGAHVSPRATDGQALLASARVRPAAAAAPVRTAPAVAPVRTAPAVARVRTTPAAARTAALLSAAQAAALRSTIRRHQPPAVESQPPTAPAPPAPAPVPSPATPVAIVAPVPLQAANLNSAAATAAPAPAPVPAPALAQVVALATLQVGEAAADGRDDHQHDSGEHNGRSSDHDH
jgi:hypothetical protein